MIFFLKLLQWIFSLVFRLPPAFAIYLMHFAGETAFQIARLFPIRKITARNLRLFFPSKDSISLTDKLLRNAGYAIFELLCLPFFKEAHFSRIIKINGLDNIDFALAKSKGVLVLTLHTGNYELIPAALSHFGYKFNSIIKSPAGPLFKFINACRTAHGTKLINVLESNMYQAAIKVLSNNEILGLLLDTGAIESRHETITFLGKKVFVATGWLALAQRSKAEIVLCTSKREGKKLIVNFSSSFTIDRNNKEESQSRIQKYFEHFILSHPEQWIIFLNKDEIKRMAEGK